MLAINIIITITNSHTWFSKIAVKQESQEFQSLLQREQSGVPDR